MGDTLGLFQENRVDLLVRLVVVRIVVDRMDLDNSSQYEMDCSYFCECFSQIGFALC